VGAGDRPHRNRRSCWSGCIQETKVRLHV
jgi:hypothetical protein